METDKKIQGIFYKIGFGILIVMVGYFLSQYVIKLNEIQKDLYKLQIEIVEMKSQLLDRAEIKEIIRQYHDTHPCYRVDRSTEQ